MRRPENEGLTALAVALALLVAGSASAQEAPGGVEVSELDIEELLDPRIGAVSLHEELASEAPASTFVLTREDLRTHGFRTLAEALRSVPGLFTYSDGFYQYVGFRGIGLLLDYTVRTLVLVDGHPLNNSLGQVENAFGPDFLVPLAAVERIEVVKGPVGGVYGPAAFLGVVNVVTTSPGSGRAGGYVGSDASQGKAIAGTASATASAVAGAFAFSAAAEGNWTRGYDWTYRELVGAVDRPAPPGGSVADLDFGDSAKAYLRATWGALAAQGGCSRWYRGLPSAPYSVRIGDRRNHEESESCFAQLGFEVPVSGALTLSGRAAHDVIRYRDRLIYDDPNADGGGDVGPFRDYGRDGWTSAELRLRWAPNLPVSGTLGATVERHRAVLDAWAEKLPSLAEDPENGLGAGPNRKAFTTLNAYLLGEWRPVDGLTLHAGVTAYHHSIFGGRVTPKGAAIWRSSKRDTLKAIYSEGFRAPSASEAFFDDVIDYIPNLRLRPETVRSAELAWERRIGSSMSLYVNGFTARYGGLIRVSTVPRPGLVGPPDPTNPADYRQQARNGSPFGAHGVEVGARVRHGRLGEAFGGMTWQHATGAEPANTAGWTANLAVSSRALWAPLSVGARIALVGPRRKEEAALPPGTQATVGTQIRLDLSTTLEVSGVRGLRVEAGVQNVFDAETLHPVANDFAPLTQMAEPPLTLRLGVRFER